MSPNFNEVHENFKFNGIHYSSFEIKEIAYSLVKEGENYEKKVGRFLLNWSDSKNFINVKTSGSTCSPKAIQIDKQSMVNSAIATGNYFDLQAGNKALHCLPTDYIAGKMMLVRAMVLGLEIDLVTPRSSPAFDANLNYDFCAMTPMQLHNTVNKIANIKCLIVGGAKVSQTLISSVQQISTAVYETYGMTETITHIAVKKLNHTSTKEYFKVLPNISIDIDERDCLVIQAHHLSRNEIVTNDIVKLIDKNEFEWLGRYDNVINSGGVKLFPEQIENKLAEFIHTPFFVTSKKDNTLGEKVVLIVEDEKNTLDPSAFSNLDKYEIPKEVYNVPKFKLTNNGKIKRKATLMTIE